MTTKGTVWTIIVIALIVLGGWWYMKGGKDQSNYSSNMATSTVHTVNTQPTASTTVMSSTTISASNQNNSDAALDQDSRNVDAQMNALNSDNASADQGLSNQNK